MTTETPLPVLELLPAVDVVNGQAVRLVQGEAGSETSYGTPLEAALNWQEQGAEWVHLVDLDAAFGRGSNAELLREVVGRLDIKVELSGGLRDDESLEKALDLGVARVNLGTAALENPEWTARAIDRFGDRIAVGLDVRGTTLAGRGWTKEGGDLWEVLGRLEEAGCARYVVTDVTKDGTLQGPNVELLRQMVEKTGKPVVASGGISSLEDLKVLRSLVPLGVEGAIVGKALYAGQLHAARSPRRRRPPLGRQRTMDQRPHAAQAPAAAGPAAPVGAAPRHPASCRATSRPRLPAPAAPRTRPASPGQAAASPVTTRRSTTSRTTTARPTPATSPPLRHSRSAAGDEAGRGRLAGRGPGLRADRCPARRRRRSRGYAAR